MLTLLTATGCRPQAWAICEKLMAQQTYAGPVRWVIVDDGEIEQPIAFKHDGWAVEVVRPLHRWAPGRNTQAENLLAGLEVIGAGERVVVIEDDDYYGRDYLAAVDRWLDRAELVGECGARYYNVQRRVGRQLLNRMHASLCSTAVRGAALVALRKECRPGVTFIDVNLWRNFKGPRVLKGMAHVVGIKGLPGRGGIGIGHKGEFAGTPDPDGALLRSWVGDDAELYL